MRIMIIGLAAAALAGSTMAQPAPGGRLPEDGVMCLENNGAAEPVECKRGSAYGPSDICICPTNAQRVDAPICGPNEQPPAESIGLMRARSVAMKDGSLYGDSYQGKRMCVKPPSRPFGRN